MLKSLENLFSDAQYVPAVLTYLPSALPQSAMLRQRPVKVARDREWPLLCRSLAQNSMWPEIGHMSGTVPECELLFDGHLDRDVARVHKAHQTTTLDLLAFRRERLNGGEDGRKAADVC